MIVDKKFIRECKPGDVICGYSINGMIISIPASDITSIYFDSRKDHKYPWTVNCNSMLMEKVGNLNSESEYLLNSDSTLFVLANETSSTPSEA